MHTSAIKTVQPPSRVVDFSVDHPRLIVAFTVMAMLLFGAAFMRTKIDTNPKNMLSPASEVRVWNDAVDKRFGLFEDNIVISIAPAAGVLNVDSLKKLKLATDDILNVKGIVARDVSGLYTIENITAGTDALRIAPLVDGTPNDALGIAALRKALFESSLFVDKVISKDAKMTAIYIPLEKGADGAQVADHVKAAAMKYFSPQEINVAGDPVARDRFGADMFKLMGMFAPVAGMLMMALMYYMFRSMWLAGIMMMTAMTSIVCAMGLAIFLGYPVHIMSSMAPVFLMAIATDSIHIFNEFFLRYRQGAERKAIILETMEAVSRPVQYTALATAAGFAVLLFMEVVPVQVFGGIMLFGTLVLRILSFTLIPALLSMVPLPGNVIPEQAARAPEFWDRQLMRMADWTLAHTRTILFGTLALVAVAGWGMSKIVVNNNMIHWFTPSAEVRIADKAINENLGGTALAYLVVDTHKPDGVKDPKLMAFVDRLQADLSRSSVVGKTFSVADYVKRMHRVMNGDAPAMEKIPDDPALIGQYLFAFSMGARQSDLNHVVDYPYQRLNVMVQLTTWDAYAMEQVLARAQRFSKEQQMDVDIKPAGAAYFNLVWNHEVLKDMIKGFSIAIAIVFLILLADFRSFKWAAIAFVPLLLTVLVVFGGIGWAGKDFDMPVAVLSCLSLGMAVDFAIHFVSRYRQRMAQVPSSGRETSQAEVLRWTITKPGKGIMRNAWLFAIAFSVMIFAPLTPYITVGVFILSMMMLSALATLTLLPALLQLTRVTGEKQ